MLLDIKSEHPLDGERERWIDKKKLRWQGDFLEMKNSLHSAPQLCIRWER